jgi:hypothetical protein
MSSPPTAKRVKLEGLETPVTLGELEIAPDDGDGEPNVDNENNCSICLQAVIDRTVIPKCSHEFCFECLLVWTGMIPALPLELLLIFIDQSNHADVHFVPNL